jgi:hypothetical protein
MLENDYLSISKFRQIKIFRKFFKFLFSFGVIAICPVIASVIIEDISR